MGHTKMRSTRSRTRAGILVPLLLTAVLLPSGGTAQAFELKTITVSSDCVDPDHVVMSDPPRGKPSRTPALRVNVLLPDGYDGKQRFPVLYLLHGLGGAYDYWRDASYGELAAAVKDLDAIVVMPEAGTTATYGNAWNGSSRTPCWERYYLEELFPTIERRYRIRSGRRWHAIGGFSSGGLGAVLHGARLPAYFGQLLSFSGVLSIQRPETEAPPASIAVALIYAPTKLAAIGPFFWNEAFGDPREQEFYWAAHNPVTLASGLSHSRIYVAHGSAAFPTCVDLVRPSEHCAVQELFGGASESNLNGPWAEDFTAAARAARAEVTYRPQAGGHFYNFSARFLADAIADWGLFKRVPEHPRRWTYKTASQTGDMWGYRFRFAKPPEVLETFVRDGRRLAGTGAGKVMVRTPRGHRFTEKLPFERRLPR